MALTLAAMAESDRTSCRKEPVLLDKPKKPNERLLRELEQKYMGKSKKSKKRR